MYVYGIVEVADSTERERIGKGKRAPGIYEMSVGAVTTERKLRAEYTNEGK